MQYTASRRQNDIERGIDDRMLYYEFAGIKMGIDCEDESLFNRLKPFMTEPSQNIDMTIHVRSFDRLEEPEGDIFLNHQVKLLRKPNHERGIIVSITSGKDSRKVIMTMEASADWGLINIDIDKTYYETPGEEGAADCERLYLVSFIGIAFRHRLLHYDGLVIHASSIAFRGKGILFTAPSGTGKSTHVGLWEEAFGSEVTVVNDDTPAMRFINDQAILSGTPWSGSSDKFANIQVPLTAIVILEQFHENTISKPNPREAVSMLIPRCFLPYFDAEATSAGFDLIEKLLSKVDVYRLKCLPDQEAVELVYQCVK